VARRVAIDSHRARMIRPREMPDAELNEIPAPQDSFERSAVAQTIRRAMQRLSADHREVIMEVYFFGRTAAQASERLAIPVGTVKSRLHYALRTLRDAVGSIE